MSVIESYWQNFLHAAGLPAETKYYDCFFFGSNERTANELSALVLSGKKRATSSALFAYELEGERLPRVGDLSIVTDWDGTPRCVIRTTAVTVLPFREMTAAIAAREGEPGGFDGWRSAHEAAFSSELREVGREFSLDMGVVFEDFEVAYCGSNITEEQ